MTSSLVGMATFKYADFINGWLEVGFAGNLEKNRLTANDTDYIGLTSEGGEGDICLKSFLYPHRLPAFLILLHKHTTDILSIRLQWTG